MRETLPVTLPTALSARHWYTPSSLDSTLRIFSELSLADLITRPSSLVQVKLGLGSPPTWHSRLMSSPSLTVTSSGSDRKNGETEKIVK